MTSTVPQVIKIMSLGLFHKVPAGAIETFFDDQNQPLFKRGSFRKVPRHRRYKTQFQGLSIILHPPQIGPEGREVYPLPWEDKKSS